MAPEAENLEGSKGIANAASKRIGSREVRRLLQEGGISPRKALGQNFLVDPNVAEKMCRIARIESGECVLEVGPGIGSLTSALAGAGALVIGVEKDPSLVGIVRKRVPEALIVCADALEDDLLEEAKKTLATGADDYKSEHLASVLWSFEGSGEWKLVSNLPYSIGTNLFLRLLEDYPKISSGAVMLQQEVAERLCAGQASRAGSAATIYLAYYARSRIAGRVPRTVFYPRPRVDSAIVEFTRRKAPPVDAPRELLFALVRTGFSSRRKMLKNAVSELKWFSDPKSAGAIFATSGIDPSSRAETLGIDGFAKLAHAVVEVDPAWREALDTKFRAEKAPRRS
jgi:16S rRNA (adenine1518-N6/adenine1519-N6)-dimethyltransferase